MSVPVGSQRRVRFYFTTRGLIVAEDKRFFDPDRVTFPGLPEGIGFDPPVVHLEYTPPGADTTVLSGASVTKDAAGEYHAIIVVPTDGAGAWSYRGRGWDGEGTAVGSTPLYAFTAE